MINILKARIMKGIVTKPAVCAADLEALGAELKSVINKNFGRSFHVREVDTGSCSACESEIISTANPLYDIQRFGINFVASPRHADALLVTGPVSKNMLIALKKTYEAMPEPKFVIALGDCSLGCSVFKDSYYVEGAVDKILPVSLHIPGCPPSPVDIIKALTAFIGKPRKIVL